MFTIISSILTWLNNNIGLITLLGGGTVIALYVKQKREFKRDVAELILQEIRYAEDQIKVARERENVFLLSNILLPTNSWYDHVHLFARDLGETDRDTISSFYSKVSFLDKAIARITEFKINGLNPVDLPRTQLPLQQATLPAGASITASPQPDAGIMQLPVSQPQRITVQQFQLNAEIMLKDVADKVECLYNTPAADKLRELSRKKWYQIL